MELGAVPYLVQWGVCRMQLTLTAFFPFPGSPMWLAELLGIQSLHWACCQGWLLLVVVISSLEYLVSGCSLAESWCLLVCSGQAIQFKNPLHLDSVCRIFLLRSIKVAVHQFLIGTGLINEQLRGLPSTNISSLCQGIHLSCISDQYLLLWWLLLPYSSSLVSL